MDKFLNHPPVVLLQRLIAPFILAIVFLSCCLGTSTLQADEFVAGPSQPTMAEVMDVAEGAADAANLSWMLVASALVLFMTAPGLAMFYSGLVRKKNVLGVMMQCLFLMGLMSVVWALWGYSLAFGGSGRFVGNFDYLFLNQLTMENGVLPGDGMPDLVFMIFQGMFFIITPALICGAFAERMKFEAMAVFSVLWGTIVYCPLCHICLLYTSPSPRDLSTSRMPSSA